MANISKEVWIEDLEKLPDGSYKKKNHIAKAKNGITFDEHLVDSMPHQFVDGNKKYKYGFKTNPGKDGLIFIYEEAI